MFAPGLFTGELIERLGAHGAALLGVGIFVAAALTLRLAGVAAWGSEYGGFAGGMALLGLAWHLSYAAATVLLAREYTAAEAKAAQSACEFAVATVSGGANLAAGLVFEAVGWHALLAIVSLVQARFISPPFLF